MGVWEYGCRTTGSRASTHTPTLPHTHTPTLPHSHTPTLPHSHTPTLPHSHTPTLPHSHTPTLPYTHTPMNPHRLIAIGFGAWLVTGVYLVPAGEQAVVRRFGGVLAR